MSFSGITQTTGLGRVIKFHLYAGSLRCSCSGGSDRGGRSSEDTGFTSQEVAVEVI